MRGYFGLGQLSASEKQDILNQHKSLYNGYQTMQPQVSNTQPLYVYDPAGDKDGVVVNNKGEVKKYTNFGINEQVEKNEVCDECGAMIMDGVCSECNYGHMEELEMEEETGDLNPKKDDFDYVESDMELDEIEVEKLNKGGKYKFRSFDEPDYDDDDIEFLDRVDYPNGIKPSFIFKGVKTNYVLSPESITDNIFDLDENDMYRYDTMESAWADEEVKEISNRVKRNALLKTMEKDKENNSNPFSVKKNLDQNRKFGQHIDPIIKREADNIAKMMGDDYSFELKKRSITNTDDKLVQKIHLDFYDGERLVSSIIITSEGDVDVAGSVPSNVERRLERLVNKIKTHELDDSNYNNIDEQDVSGTQGIYGGMKKAYDFDSKGPGKAGPYQRFSYESELEEYDSEEDFGFASHDGSFGGDDSEEDFGFATHSGDFGGDDSEEDEWEEIDVDMKESFITQKNKISEMFNRLNKFN